MNEGKKITGIEDHARDGKILSLEEQKIHIIIPERNLYFTHCFFFNSSKLYLNLDFYSEVFRGGFRDGGNTIPFDQTNILNILK